MFNFKKINISKFNIKSFKKSHYILFNKYGRFTLKHVKKSFIFFGGNRVTKKKIQIFNLYETVGLQILNRKPFSKPINKLKLKL